MNDSFINIDFSTSNLDRYYVRNSIYSVIQLSLLHFHGDLIDIGCGKMPYKEFIVNNSSIHNYTGLDIADALEYDVAVKPDFTWDGVTMPFEDEQFNTAFATEVLEHCPKPEIVLKEAYRVLKPGGVFFFTVPFLWPLHEVPHDEFRYTPFSLKRLLIDVGFENIEIKALGGWHASMAQMLGLWVRRSPMNHRLRTLLSWLILPIYKCLLKKDILPEKFSESQMITGIWGIAYK